VPEGEEVDVDSAARDVNLALLQELQHRVKNTLATTLAIVKFSARGASDIESFVLDLRGRLSALSRTHDLLTANEWRGGSLRTLVTAECDPYGGDRVTFEGDDARLTTKEALSLGLAIHELATNAAKYGGLSQDGGRVVVTSGFENAALRITWKESGGPPVNAPTGETAGFGSFLLNRVLSHDIGGTVVVDYGKSGVRCDIVLPRD
jgi:two-component sensor histidine kinase